MLKMNRAMIFIVLTLCLSHWMLSSSKICDERKLNIQLSSIRRLAVIINIVNFNWSQRETSRRFERKRRFDGIRRKRPVTFDKLVWSKCRPLEHPNLLQLSSIDAQLTSLLEEFVNRTAEHCCNRSVRRPAHVKCRSILVSRVSTDPAKTGKETPQLLNSLPPGNIYNCLLALTKINRIIGRLSVIARNHSRRQTANKEKEIAVFPISRRLKTTRGAVRIWARVLSW